MTRIEWFALVLAVALFAVGAGVLMVTPPADAVTHLIVGWFALVGSVAAVCGIVARQVEP